MEKEDEKDKKDKKFILKGYNLKILLIIVVVLIVSFAIMSYACIKMKTK